CSGLHLLRRLLCVVAGHRAVGDATAGELRRTGRTLTGPAGALLAVRLPAAAAHHAAGLGRVRALPRGGALRHHNLWDQLGVPRGGEERVRQLDGAGLVARRRHDVDGAHQFPSRAAERTTTSPPRGPGIAPLMRSRFLSPSTACTVRLCTVVRSAPIRPAILTPLKTRPGVAHAPIEPGERCLRWVPCEAERPLKWCRFMTPAKPLPLDLPVTSTRWPAANSSAVSSCPSVYSEAPSVRISAMYRRGVTPAFSNWPLI